MPDITIKGEKVIHEGHTKLKEVSYEQKKNDGTMQQLKREVLDHGNAVSALLYNPKQRKVLLTRQFRLPAYLNGHASGYLLEACAGLMENDKDPMEAMKREVEEETGYEIREMEKVAQVYSSAGALTELIYLFIAPYNSKRKKAAGGGLQEEGEDIVNIELDYDEVKKMLKEKEISDAKTLILLQYMQLQGLLDQ